MIHKGTDGHGLLMAEKQQRKGAKMRQVHDSPQRVRRYDSATMHEALRLRQSGLKSREVALRMNIPRGSIGRLINVARQAQAQEPTDGSRELANEPHAPEELQMPESFVAFFNYLTRRAFAAEDELQETKKLLADKTAEATRAWAEFTAQAKTDISREFAAVYEDYKTGRR
jgi:hypothetical protein